MYKLCKTEHSAQRQRMIEEALLEMMGTKRYEDISVSDLCTATNIPRKAFYRYFDNKDSCLEALLDRKFMEYEHQEGLHQIHPSWTLRISIRFFFEYWKQQHRLLEALAKSNLSGLLVQHAIDYYRSKMKTSLISGEQDVEFNKLASSFIICGILTMVMEWHEEGYVKTAEEMAAMTSRLLEQPLIPMT